MRALAHQPRRSIGQARRGSVPADDAAVPRRSSVERLARRRRLAVAAEDVVTRLRIVASAGAEEEGGSGAGLCVDVLGLHADGREGVAHELVLRHAAIRVDDV